MLLSLVLLLTACGPDSFLDRRDMYANVTRNPKVKLVVDWMKKCKKKPTGMTVLMPGMKEKSKFCTSTNSVDGIDLNLCADVYPVLVYNLSPDEFGSMDFHNDEDYDSIHVTLTPITMRANESWDKDVKYLREPEDLAVALDTIEITDEMTEKYSAVVRQRLSDGIPSDKADTVMYVFHETTTPIISTLNVVVRVLGLNNAASVEGNISGMADGAYLTQLHSTSGQGIHLLDKWKGSYDKGSKKDGYITTSINTFGLPHGTEYDLTHRDSTLNYLTLNFKLVDGKTTRTFRYPVGNDFKYVTNENGQYSYTNTVTLQLNLTIDADSRGNDFPSLPDVDPEKGNSGTGFDANVDDWEDGGSQDIIL